MAEVHRLDLCLSQRLPDARREDGRELRLKVMLPAAVFLQHIVFRAGMHHDLRRPLWQMRNEVQELAFADSLARNDAGKIIRRQEASAVRLAGGEACKRAEAQAPDELPEPAKRTGKARRRP